MPPALESTPIAADNVSVVIGEQVLLNSVSFSISTSEVVAIVGRNGAGKTTLLRALLGEVPSCGVVTMLGAVPPFRPATLERLGAVIGNPVFVPWMSSRSFCRMLIETSGEFDRGQVASALELVGLRAVARRRISKLSQGMRQRLAVASALLNEPDVLVLDEPMTHLDDESRVVVAGILRTRRLATIYTAHYAEDLASADRVLQLERGKLVFDETPAAYLARRESS